MKARPTAKPKCNLTGYIFEDALPKGKQPIGSMTPKKIAYRENVVGSNTYRFDKESKLITKPVYPSVEKAFEARFDEYAVRYSTLMAEAEHTRVQMFAFLHLYRAEVEKGRQKSAQKSSLRRK